MSNKPFKNFLLVLSVSFTLLLPGKIYAFSKNETLINSTGNFGLQSEIILPEGQWVVAGMKAINGGVRPVDVILIQKENTKIKALLNIKFPRSKGLTQGWDAVTGWKPKEHYDNNNCDDYDNQRSNFHHAEINKRKQQLILEGYCLAIFAKNSINSATSLATKSSLIDAFQNADEYIRNNNLSYPDAMVVIGNTYFTEENQIHINYMVNPDFANIPSKPGLSFSESDWYQFRINDYEEKKKFMSNAIYIGKSVNSEIARSYSKRKAIDLRPYNQILTFKTISNAEVATEEDSLAKKLQDLKSLHNQNLISDSQYEEKMNQLLEEL